MTVLTFGWAKPPLSANDRYPHWAVKGRITKEVRSAAKFTAIAARLPKSAHITVQLIWVVTDERRRDSDNTYPTFKAMCDGIVDAGIVPDDTPQYMTKLGPVIRHEPGGTARIELEVTT